MYIFPIKTYETFDFFGAGNLLCDISESDTCSYTMMAAQGIHDLNEIKADKNNNNTPKNTTTRTKKNNIPAESPELRAQNSNKHPINIGTEDNLRPQASNKIPVNPYNQTNQHPHAIIEDKLR